MGDFIYRQSLTTKVPHSVNPSPNPTVVQWSRGSTETLLFASPYILTSTSVNAYCV